MLKRLVAIAAMAVTVPVMAYAGATWSLNTWVRSNGGTITITDMNGVQSAAQDVTFGQMFNNYTTTGTISAKIQAQAGYTANIYENAASSSLVGVTPFATLLAGGSTTITATSASSLEALWVVFKPSIISVTAAGDAHSTVNLASVPNIYYGTTALAAINFTFTAAPGYVIQSITNVPAGATTTGLNSALAKVTLPKTFAFPSSGIALASVSVANTTGTTVANAGAAQTVGVNTAVTLTGTYAGTGPAFQGWSSVARPQGAAQPFTKAAGASQTFTPAVTGTYVFLFRTDASTALTSVQVQTTAPVAVTNLSTGRTCQACHTSNGIADPNIYANYSAGNTHKNSTHSACTACHYNVGNGGHPGTVNADTVNPSTFLVNYANINAGGPNANLITPPGPGVVFCSYCHNGSYGPAHLTVPLNAGVTCAGCHTDPNGQGAGTGDAHSVQPLPGCVTCHAVNQAQVNATLVNDNNGVRAITGTNGEFGASNRTNTGGFRSHHIYNGTNTDPQDAQCIACHLEGKGTGRAVSVDATYHMADGMVHLRSGNTAISANFAWDPQNPNHTGMDNFCLSCHNAAGAVSAYANISSALIAANLAGQIPARASALNPFGDQLKNAYDGLTRPQVIAVYEQFDTNNVAHHAVRGKKYSGAYRSGNPYNVSTAGHTASTGNFTQYSGATIGNIHIIASSGVPQVEEYFGTYSTSGPAAGFDGGKSSGSRKTLYEAGLFVANYTTLDGATIGDDSTLHCGDCHSVGQWKSGSANAVVFNNISNAQFGYTVQATTQVIGAHGSKNEYMLRTANGADALHTQGSTAKSSGVAPNVVYRASSNGTYVCYLCHLQQAYGDNNYFRTDAGVGITGWRDHAGVHYSNGCDSSAQQSVGKVGYTARIGTVGSGNLGTVFGYTCAHCHSSGNAVFGGIHGSASATGSKNITFISYSTDGTDIIGSTLPGGYSTRSYTTEHDTLNAVQRLPYRFMGGTGLRYNGGGTASKWEAKTLNGKHREGCYNLNATTATTALWNTTSPKQTLAGGPGGNAILNNGGTDSLDGAYADRTAQNNQINSGWGACNHHGQVNTTSSTAPTRSVQRPLVY